MKFLRKLTGFLLYAVPLCTIAYAVWYYFDLQNDPLKYGYDEADPCAAYQKLCIIGIIALGVFLGLAVCYILIGKRMKALGISNLTKKEQKAGIIWKSRRRNALGLPWTLTKYLVDQDRLYIRSGLLNSREEEVRLYRIVDVTLKRMFFQKIFGIGTIHCDSSDTTLKNFDIKNIRHSREVKKMLAKLIDESRLRNKVYSSEAVAGAPHGAHGPIAPPPEIDRTDVDANGIPDVYENDM